jgi:hypothetical protein
MIEKKRGDKTNETVLILCVNKVSVVHKFYHCFFVGIPYSLYVTYVTLPL